MNILKIYGLKVDRFVALKNLIFYFCLVIPMYLGFT